MVPLIPQSKQRLIADFMQLPFCCFILHTKNYFRITCILFKDLIQHTTFQDPTLPLCWLNGPLIKYPSSWTFLMFWMFNPTTYSYFRFDTVHYAPEPETAANACSLVVRHWMVFFKIRPRMKRNNVEFTYVSSFTSCLMCSTHFTLSCRIFLFSFPTTNNFFKFVYSEITEETVWRVLFRPPRCCLLLWQLRIIRNWLTSNLDFRYPGPSYLMQKVLVLYFFVCI